MQQQVNWMQDLSNFTDKYKRNQVRIGLDAFFKYSKIDKNLFQNNLLKTLSYVESCNSINMQIIKEHTKQIHYDVNGFILISNFVSVSQNILFFLIKEVVQNFNVEQEIRAHKINYLLNLIKANLPKIKYTFFGICAEKLNNNLIFYLLPNFKKLDYIVLDNINCNIDILKEIQIKTNFTFTPLNNFYCNEDSLNLYLCNVLSDASCNNHFNTIVSKNLNKNNYTWLNLFNLYFATKDNKDSSNIIKEQSPEFSKQNRYIIDLLTQEEYSILMQDEQFLLKISNYFKNIEKILLQKNIAKLIKSIISSLPVIKIFNIATKNKKIVSIPHLQYFISV